MTCGCGRSPDGCRGWHNLSEEQYQVVWKEYLETEDALFTVTDVEHYTDSLFRFKTHKPMDYQFKAGEFTMIGFPGDNIRRAYSITSAPSDPWLEFYSIKVPNGPLTSKLQHIQPGDVLEIGSKPTGSLTVDYVKPGGNLWLLATGTGIAPFMSLLRDRAIWERYNNIHVAWSVRTQDELAAYDGLLRTIDIDYTPVVTQDPNFDGCKHRITTMIRGGALMNGAQPETDKVMICGSMPFNTDMKDLLTAYNWVEGTSKEPGSFVLERAFVS